VDYKSAPGSRCLQKCDIVKLLNFSPVLFDLFRQELASGC
jgi:hypothetical protein